MNSKIKNSLIWLLLLSSFVNIKAQKKADSPILSSSDNDSECGLISPPLIEITVSVRSSKKGELKKLTYKDFEVYDEKMLQIIESFKFDESKRQYSIGFYPIVSPLKDNKRHDVKIKIKLSAEKKKEYGKVFVSGQKGYYPN